MVTHWHKEKTWQQNIHTLPEAQDIAQDKIERMIELLKRYGMRVNSLFNIDLQKNKMKKMH